MISVISDWVLATVRAIRFLADPACGRLQLSASYNEEGGGWPAEVTVPVSAIAANYANP
jgi:hypothetical protein